MHIDILCQDGSPLRISLKSIWGDRTRVGVGGAELALLTMCEEWHKAGHEVVLYNNPIDPNGSPFEQRSISTFEGKSKRDVLIIFRSPNPRGVIADGLKVWWSTDQYTTGDFGKFSSYVDKIVCISEHHKNYFEDYYNIKKAIVIDLPVRVNDFPNGISKIPNRLIFTSVPDRGLVFLRRMWPQLKQEIPDLSLTITSDYRLWGAGPPMNEQHRLHWIGQEGARFLGAIPRKDLIEEELKAQILAYPCLYDELFCISCGEAMVAGAYPITSSIGALGTTNMGTVIQGHPQDYNFPSRFMKEIVSLLKNPDKLKEEQRIVRKKAIERFHPDNILRQWEERVFDVT